MKEKPSSIINTVGWWLTIFALAALIVHLCTTGQSALVLKACKYLAAAFCVLVVLLLI